MRHFQYRGFGLSIESEIELPELSPREGFTHAPDIAIRFGSVPSSELRSTLNEDLAINQVGATFLIESGHTITVDVHPGAHPASVRAVLLGKVMAFLLRQRGWLPLHGSGVLLRDKGVLFLGVSGSGKSTLATAFYRAGHSLISDDVCPVRINSSGDCVVQPAWPHVRLPEDVSGLLREARIPSKIQLDKYRFDLSQSPLPSTCAVGAICILEKSDSLSLFAVPPLQAASLLSRESVVRHFCMDRPSLEQHIRDCAAIASRVKVWQLRRPVSIEAMTDVIRLIEQRVDLQPPHNYR